MNEVLARETTKNQLQPSTQHREVVFEDVLMNTQRPSPLNPKLPQPPKPSRRFFWPLQLGGVLGLSWILLAMGTAQAATTLAWDPNASGASDGSGTWHGGNTWWNGTADQAWVDGSVVFIGTNTAPGEERNSR